MNIAYGSIVSSNNISFNALRGNKTNWDYGMSKPMIEDIKGILNVLRDTGTLKGKMCPLDIWHCGTVGEMKG